MTNNPFAISAIGMDIERLRVDVAAMNLANAHVAVSATGEGYRPLQVVARVNANGSFSTQFDQWLQSPAVSVEPTLNAPRQVLEPGHPLADDKGFVRYPAIDHTTEMFTMMGAMRAYEANVAAMNTSRAMVLKALDIGGAQ
ncbi:MAG TPA: flagellar basal body rod protein FlgC [Ideonella sp.]|uniref:flagellar basal body rod protein FlgC n=1 Tax=Ideonella sp. TaxID=1929293 RepID=UPI002E32CEC9|nr:flagellar basal body rod protein FlgC [Ideonella sp.]HEX5682648.1 flagellar basal body rod protein FlgC [Ideonella sp.]